MANFIRKRRDSTHWRSQFEDLALTASAAPAASERTLIESLLGLLASMPMRAQSIGYREPNPRELLPLLDANGSASAILLMLPAQSGLMTSRGTEGCHIASVILRTSPEESTSVGHTFALAVVGAFALAVADSDPDSSWTGQSNQMPSAGQHLDWNAGQT